MYCWEVQEFDGIGRRCCLIQPFESWPCDFYRLLLYKWISHPRKPSIHITNFTNERLVERQRFVPNFLFIAHHHIPFVHLQPAFVIVIEKRKSPLLRLNHCWSLCDILSDGDFSRRLRYCSSLIFSSSRLGLRLQTKLLQALLLSPITACLTTSLSSCSASLLCCLFLLSLFLLSIGFGLCGAVEDLLAFRGAIRLLSSSWRVWLRSQ